MVVGFTVVHFGKVTSAGKFLQEATVNRWMVLKLELHVVSYISLWHDLIFYWSSSSVDPAVELFRASSHAQC